MLPKADNPPACTNFTAVTRADQLFKWLSLQLDEGSLSARFAGFAGLQGKGVPRTTADRIWGVPQGWEFPSVRLLAGF